MKIEPYYEAVAEAEALIKKFQTGEEVPLVTGRPWLDDIMPVVNGNIITIGAGSGIGKSYELMRLMGNVMSKKLNPDAEEYVFLNISLEMQVFSLVTRELSRKTKVSKKDFLFDFDSVEEEIKEEFEAILRFMKKDKRMFINQQPTTPNQFYEATRKFALEHKNKKRIFIALDHMALLSPDGSEGRNQIIENFIMRVNQLKLEFKNLVFILLSQTNSSREERLEERSQRSQPRQSDLYYSGFTFQISDFVIIMVNPYKDKISEYSLIYPDMYPNLEEYYGPEDNRGRVSLESIGVIYYHLLKCRDADDATYIDIYGETLNFPGLEELREKKRQEKKPAVPVIDFSGKGMKDEAILGKSAKKVLQFNSSQNEGTKPFEQSTDKGGTKK